LRVIGVRVLGEERRRRHDLAGWQKPHCGTPSSTHIFWHGWLPS